MTTRAEPDNPGTAYTRQVPELQICRDVYGGTLRLREKTTEYLRQFPREPDAAYGERVKEAVLFNAFGRTVDGLTGMVMREDPELGDDVPATISDKDGGHWQNIDLEGTHGAVFARAVLADALVDGHTFIFVDFQDVGDSVQTREQERELGLRPYWVPIKKSQVVRWQSEQIAGNVVLTHVAWKEITIEPTEEFKDEEVERVRIYRRRSVFADDDGSMSAGVTVQIWRKEKKEWTEETPEKLLKVAGGKPLERIPLAVVYARREGFLCSRPPLLDLALENITHYQLRSDRMNTLHVAGVPVPIFIGRVKQPGEELAAGVGWGIDFDLNGDAKYLEPEGNALEASRTEQQDIETRMATLGLAMLQPDTRAAETAKARELDKSEKDSALMVVARSLRDAMENALQFHADWQGEESGGTVAVNLDFKQLALSPEQVKQYREMVASGQLSVETMWERLTAGEWLDKSFDAETERERISEDDAQSLADVPGPPDPPSPPDPPMNGGASGG